MSVVMVGLLWGSVALVAIPMVVVVVECLAAAFGVDLEGDESGVRPQVTVLVPAHNEELVIRETLQCLQAQTGPADEIVVIADNCTDRTAEIGRECGVVVWERVDGERRGKSYALDFGVRRLAEEGCGGGVVVIMDADVIVEAGGVERLARAALRRNGPVQGAYVLKAPDRNLQARIAEWAFYLRNVIRPMGLRRLGLPCLLNGTGMAFPWELLQGAYLASGRIAEDRWLGLELAIAGRPPVFVPVFVSGEFPQRKDALQTQRERWEHGHLEALVMQTPKLVWEALRQRRVELMALALELSVPPLSLLVTMWLISMLVNVLVGVVGGPTGPLLVLTVVGGLWGGCMLWAQKRWGETGLVAGIPEYVRAKAGLYVSFVGNRQRQWIPTARTRNGERGEGEG